MSHEQKFLTLLSADLQGSTLLIAEMDPEAAIARLEPALAVMRSAVHRNGGIISKEQGDGIVALFGAPRADDNHAIMACHAALDVVRGIGALNDADIRVRVGVHSGYVITHVVESDYSAVYEAGGPAMHLVDRLQKAGEPGEILVSPSCMALCEGLFAFKPRGPLDLKGFSHPVTAGSVLGVSGLSRWDARSARGLSAFVGRSDEMAVLNRAAEEAKGRSGRVVVFDGDPGVGKSRVAHEFVHGLGWAGWQVLEVGCSPLAQATPYAVLKQLLQTALRDFQASATSDEGEVIGSTEFDQAALWREALRAVLDEPVDRQQWRDLEPMLRRRSVIQASRDAIRRVISSKPTVLLVEDLHWIDAESQTAIDAIASLVHGDAFLILMTTRSRVLPEWLDRHGVERCSIQPLDVASSRTLLDQLLGGIGERDELKERVLAHTGGVPLYIEEVSRQLLEMRLMTDAGGRGVTQERGRELGIPPTVQGVIAARIDRLVKSGKALLQLCSAIGPIVDFRLLIAVTGMRASGLRAQLSKLQTAGFLLAATAAQASVYEFSHALIREVAYESILRQRRKELHQLILTGMESLSNFSVEALCHHAREAELWDKVGDYGHLAAQRAMDRSAFRDATRYFQTAIDAVDRLPGSHQREARSIDLRLEARMAFASFGELDRWLALAQEAEQRAAADGDAQRLVAAAAVRAAALNFCVAPPAAISAGEHALKQAERLGATAWLSYTEYGLGQAYFLAGRYRDAERMLERACARLTDAPEAVPIGTTGPRLLVLCYMMKAISHGSMGELDRADDYVHQAADIAGANKRPYERIAAGYADGVVRLLHSDPAGGGEILANAVEVSRQNEVRQFIPVLMCQLGNAYFQQGRLDEARDALEKARSEAAALGHTASVALGATYLAMVLANLGQRKEAMELARSAEESATQQGYRWVAAQALFAQSGIIALQPQSDLQEAKRLLYSAMEIAATIEARPLIAIARTLLASLLRREGDAAAATEELRLAVGLFTEMKMTKQLKRAMATLTASQKA